MKICLVIVYNHNYEKNIPVLNRIYAGRFSHIFHVMPFYQGSDPHVIGVYENSFQFSGYIAQAYVRLPKDCAQYVFVADDMVLNPTFDETNIVNRLNLLSDTCITTGVRVVTDQDFLFSSLIRPSIIALNYTCNACEWRRFMLDSDAAWELFEKQGFSRVTGVSRRLYEFFSAGQRLMRKTYFHTKWIPPFGFLTRFARFFASNEKLYPLATGYSDFLIIPQGQLSNFSHMCGVLAAARVFVEVAIPTALVLSSNRIRLVEQTGYKCETGVADYSVRQKLEQESQLDYGQFSSKFPADYLFIHPIKLSKWKNLP